MPAFNEAPTLVELYERTRRVLNEIGRKFEFIIVDDGSTDDTPAVSKKLIDENPDVTVIRHARNQGKSIALMQAFEAANGYVLVTMDADLQDQPEMIPRLLEKIDAGYDLVNGLRIRRKDKLVKRLVSQFYNRFVSRVFDCSLQDVNCGLKAMRSDVYRSLELYGDQHRLIPILAILRGFNCTETPVNHEARKIGKSKYGLIRHRGLLDVIAMVAVNASRTRPFHFFCELAFMFWCLAALSFVGWALISLDVSQNDETLQRILGNLLGALGTWAAFTGTVLPLFGLFMEVEIRRFQDKIWRSRLVTVVKSKKQE